MYTIGMLRRALGLSSDNQVRNRLEAIKDLLSDYTRRGPNNQILLSEEGLGLVRRLQEYHEAGLTLTEASHMITATTHNREYRAEREKEGLRRNATKQRETVSVTPEESTGRELSVLREHVAVLEELVRSAQMRGTQLPSDRLWWLALREDVDVA